jgi:hypothetical protein
MPTGNDDKSLDRFLEVVHSNQPINRARFPAQYQIIQRIDKCFVTVGKHLSYQKPVLVGPMFLRSQYAYKTSAGMTLAGQVAESFVMMRSCLEYAGYALAMYADPRFIGTFHPRWFGGPLSADYLTDRPGANLDGMLAEYAV